MGGVMYVGIFEMLFNNIVQFYFQRLSYREMEVADVMICV
jgi:hypothetical protein